MDLLFSIIYMNFNLLTKSFSILTYVYLQDWNNFTKYIFRLQCSILGHALEIDDKFNLNYQKHSNFYLKSTT
jgi:hypothetical protein